MVITVLQDQGPAQLPPPLTGGQKTVTGGFQLSVDWVSATFTPSHGSLTDVGQVQLAVSLALDCDVKDWVDLDSGAYGYRAGRVGPGGARLYWDAPNRVDIHVSLPGKACQLVGGDRMCQYLAFVQSRGKPTRVDITIDDYNRTVVPAQVQTALQGPDVVTHAQKVLTHQGFKVGDPTLTGATVYLGAPASRQRLRVYDKGLESGGEKDCVRWELQVRAEAAETLVVALAYRDWPTVFTERLVSFVDFRSKGSHSEVEKRSRLSWFQELVGLAMKGLVYAAKATRTVQELVAWVDKSIGPSLAVAMKFWKGDLGPLTDILQRGQQRWRPKHVAMLLASG